MSGLYQMDGLVEIAGDTLILHDFVMEPCLTKRLAPSMKVCLRCEETSSSTRGQRGTLRRATWDPCDRGEPKSSHPLREEKPVIDRSLAVSESIQAELKICTHGRLALREWCAQG